MTLDAEFLAECDRHDQAATPGGWAVAPWSPRVVLPKPWADDPDDVPPEDRGPFAPIHAQNEADAAFIAFARTALPRLVAGYRDAEAALRDERALADRLAEAIAESQAWEHDVLIDVHRAWQEARLTPTEMVDPIREARDALAAAEAALRDARAVRDRLGEALTLMGAMPDAGFTEDDPRWSWWHSTSGPRLAALAAWRAQQESEATA